MREYRQTLDMEEYSSILDTDITELMGALEQPKNGKELKEETGIPIATVYRKLRSLGEKGLTEEHSKPNDEASKRGKYLTRKYDSIRIDVAEPGVYGVEHGEETLQKLDAPPSIIFGGKYTLEALNTFLEGTTSKELEECEIPLATAYRRIDELEDAGIIEYEEKFLNFSPENMGDQKLSKVYGTPVKSFEIDFKDSEIRVEEEKPGESERSERAFFA